METKSESHLHVDSLVEQCQSGDASAQIHAMHDLADTGAQQAVPAILLLLKSSEDEDVRTTAAYVLGKLGADHVDQVGPVLAARLSDVDESVRNQAAESLSQLRYQPARAALESMLLGDEYWVARASAAEALGALGDAQAVPALLKALTDEYYPVRSYAAYAIGRLGDASVLPAIQEHLSAETHRGPRAELLIVAIRFGDESVFDDLLALCSTVEPDDEPSGNVLSAIKDLLRDGGLPAVVKRRAAELGFALTELGRRSGKEEYAAELAARLAEQSALP